MILPIMKAYFSNEKQERLNKQSGKDTLEKSYFQFYWKSQNWTL